MNRTRTRQFLFVAWLMLACGTGGASDLASVASYTLDAGHSDKEILTGHLRMGTPTNPGGEAIAVNNLHLSRGGKPWLPVMGEIHFSRYPRHLWEDAIRKAKAAGVDIIASYVFWNHHEEVEGQFDWSGQRNLREFIQLCAAHGLNFYPRIGPWCHGEARNGGFPDWVERLPGKRRDEPQYLTYVRRLYGEIFRQCEGLLYKDGGPIIGIQLENEYSGPTQHIVTLKNLAREAGFDVPLYTATGWDVNIPEDEVVPVHGGYADAPWADGTDQLHPNGQYLFYLGLPTVGTGIGSDVLPYDADKFHEQYDKRRYPWLMAELGLGNQIKHNRRPIITPEDARSLLVTKLAGGANLIGYYIYHGGTNPDGKLTTLEEPGYPPLSYDFQCAISEFGETNRKYRETKLVHYWLQDFGHELATMLPILPQRLPAGVEDVDTLRFMGRFNRSGSGYLFLSNYQRYVENKPVGPQQIVLELPGETLTLPTRPFTMPKDGVAIWPVNLDLDGVRIKWATAQLVCRLPTDEGETYFFLAPPGIEPEFVFDATTVKSIKAEHDSVRHADDGRMLIATATPSLGSPIRLVSAAGKAVTICTLPYDDALRMFRFRTLWGQERVVIADGDVLVGADGELAIRRIDKPADTVWIYPAPQRLASNAENLVGESVGLFTQFPLPNVAPVEPSLALRAEEGVAGRWQIDVPTDALAGVLDVYLDIDYVGDVARIRAEDEVLADHFYYGPSWRPSLRHWGPEVLGKTLTLEIDAITPETKCYLEPEARPDFRSLGERIAVVRGFRAEPQYETVLRAGL